MAVVGDEADPRVRGRPDRQQLVSGVEGLAEAALGIDHPRQQEVAETMAFQFLPSWARATTPTSWRRSYSRIEDAGVGSLCEALPDQPPRGFEPQAGGVPNNSVVRNEMPCLSINTKVQFSWAVALDASGVE